MVKDFQEKLNTSHNFVDYFLSIGLDPDIFSNQWLYESSLEDLNGIYKEYLKPKIINKFPSFEKKNIGLDDTIIHHCFPLGFKIQEFAERPSSKLFSILLDNKNFSTILPYKYVICLLFYESISDYRKVYEKYYNVVYNKNNAIHKYQSNSFSYENHHLFYFNDNASNYSTNTNYNNNAMNKLLNNYSIVSNKLHLSEISQRDTNMSSFINKNYYNKYYIPKCICLVSLYPLLLN